MKTNLAKKSEKNKQFEGYGMTMDVSGPKKNYYSR